MKKIITRLALLILLPISLLAQTDFLITGSTNQEHEPVIAYNSVDDEYLVVWSEMAPLGMGNYLFGGVYGQRYSSAGQKVGSAFTIFTMATSPSVAYNSKTNEYVVAVEEGGNVVGQMLNSTGGKVGAVRNIIDNAILPQILYNDLLRMYFLACYRYSPENKIWTTSITEEFTHTTPQPTNISNDSTFSISYAPIAPSGRYLLSTSSRHHRLLKHNADLIKDIVLETGYPEGGYVDGEGYSSLISSKHAIVDAAFGYKDDKPVFMVVYADNNNEWVWPAREGVTTELLCGVWGGYIDAVNPPDQITDSYFPIGDWLLERNCLARWKPKVVYNDVAKKFIVAWNEYPTTASGNKTKVNHIRATDKFANEVGFVNTVLSATNGKENPDYPVMATSTKSNKAFVVWEDHRDSTTNDTDLYGSMYSFTITPPPTTVPKAPDNLVAILSPPNTINLSWSDNSDNEDEFHLERKDPDDGLWYGIGILSVNTTSYIEPGLELGTTYYYRVRAKNSIGFSTYSNEAHATTSPVITIPTAPSNLSAILSLPTTIALLWNDNSNDEDAFHVERKESAGGTWSEIAVLGANIAYLTDPGLGGGKTFYYRVRAKNSAGFSAYSNEASATTNQGTSSITVISPNGGEVLFFGYQHEIKWTSTNFTGPVRIDYLLQLPVDRYDCIVLNTPNDGSFLWTVGAFTINFWYLPCTIRIADATKNELDEPDDGKVYDWSDLPFTIVCGHTEVGTDVQVGAGNDVFTLFSNVTGSGNTTASKKTTGSPPPGGFQVVPIGAGVYYEITTTATFTGNVRIEITYDDTGLTLAQEKSLKMLVYEVPPGNWKDITHDVNTSTNLIEGYVNHFSEFAIMLPTSTSGGMIVTNTDDSGPGSLREAINSANSHMGMDTILFNIPKHEPGVYDVPGYDANLGVWTIEPQAELPAITDDGLLIDGISQSEFIGEDTNPNGPEIQIAGLAAGDYAIGLWVKASYVDISGISINHFKGTGIFVEGAEGGKISGCYVGCGVNGDELASNGYGITLSNGTRYFHISPADTIPNVISGNTNVGIQIHDSSSHNLILGNIIGLNRDRNEPIPNENHGGIEIAYESDSNYVVDNLISGNSIGVNIYASDYNLIQNNLIGTNYEWIALGNENNGINISEGAQGNLIKENVIAFNGGNGVTVRDSQTIFNTITRSSIASNGAWGIALDNGGNENIAAPQITSASMNEISGTAVPNSIVEIFTDPDNQGIFFHDSTVADASGNFTWSGTIESEYTNITTTATDDKGNTSMFSAPMVITSVNKVSEIPESFELSQNYPNPFNPSTKISYSLPEQSHVQLRIYDVIGREVAELVNEEQPAGAYSVRFDARNLTSGVYFYKIQAGDFVETKKIVLLR